MKIIFLILNLSSFFSHYSYAQVDANECVLRFRSIASGDEKYVQQRMAAIVLEEITDDYHNVQRNLTSKEIHRWNKVLLSSMNKLPLTGDVRGRRGGLSWREIKRLYRKVAKHPVGDYEKVEKYDPEDRFGFCFGRAMIAHMEAINTRLAKENIRKIWAVGNMKWDGASWDYHVATMVRAKKGKWYVIDPILDVPVSLKTWMSEIKDMDSDDRLQFYVTNANRWGPTRDLRSRHKAAARKEMVSLPFELGVAPSQRNQSGLRPYNGFFQDAMEYSRREAAELKQQIEKSRTGK